MDEIIVDDDYATEPDVVRKANRRVGRIILRAACQRVHNNKQQVHCISRSANTI